MNPWKLYARRLKRYPPEILRQLAKKHDIDTAGNVDELAERISKKARSIAVEKQASLLGSIQ